MMRVIAGTAAGRLLESVPGRDVRPTTDRVKSILFDIVGQWVVGSRVLDLFAGTGALGIEALSRGAARAVFVDNNLQAVRVIRANLTETELADPTRARVLRQEAFSALKRLDSEGEKFDLVLADPPYRWVDFPSLTALLVELGMLDESALIVFQHSTRQPIAELPPPLKLVRQRRAGETTLTFIEAESLPDN